MKVPFVSFSGMHNPIKSDMLSAFEKVYDSHWYINGTNVDSFEKAYAKFNNVEQCVGVSNGLDALHLALLAAGIQKGDEVLVPSNTYIATVLAITYVGATPIFVEPDEKTYNINPANLANALSSKTKAIMPVHLYGQSCQMTEIVQFATEHNLIVIEDNAQSQGATYNNRLTGTWGFINGTSFYPGKNLGALGDAGAITTNDKQAADKIRSLRNYGSAKKYHNELIGFNMRLDELQAALLEVKLQYIHQWSASRQEIAGWYFEELENCKEIILPYTHPNATNVYHCFVIRTERRDELQNFLNEQEIGTLIHYPIPPHLQKAFVHLGHQQGDFPIAEQLANTMLSLPVWPGLTKQQVQQVCNVIKKFFAQ
jgi:dTDP-4-amino-4,6-dideoxygalactose transaminase